jgi:hypothetical protein
MMSNSFTPPDEDLSAGLPGPQELRRMAAIKVKAPKCLLFEPIAKIDDGSILWFIYADNTKLQLNHQDLFIYSLDKNEKHFPRIQVKCLQERLLYMNYTCGSITASMA